MKLTDDYLFNLVERFNDSTLPEKEFTHEAHIIVGAWHAFHYPAPAAADLVRRRIKQLNLSNGKENTASEGYHETITLFWIWTLSKFIRQNQSPNFLVAVRQLFQSPVISSDYPLNYYSYEVLFSEKARQQWVFPDKNGLLSLLYPKAPTYAIAS